MGILRHLVRGDADDVHGMLQGVRPSSHQLTGGIVLTDQNRTVLMRQTANFHGNDYHVEKDLLSNLFTWSQSNGGAWTLPANSRLYLYVYNSPCTVCAQVLKRTRSTWYNKGNVTVRWKFGFTVYYLRPRLNGHEDVNAANAAYNATGWAYKRV